MADEIAFVFSEGGRLLGETQCTEMNLFLNEDDRFTNEFLENNIASVGVPLFVAKAVTGAISLTGKTPSQFIDWIRTKLKV